MDESPLTAAESGQGLHHRDTSMRPSRRCSRACDQRRGRNEAAADGSLTSTIERRLCRSESQRRSIVCSAAARLAVWQLDEASRLRRRPRRDQALKELVMSPSLSKRAGDRRADRVCAVRRPVAEPWAQAAMRWGRADARLLLPRCAPA